MLTCGANSFSLILLTSKLLAILAAASLDMFIFLFWKCLRTRVFDTFCSLELSSYLAVAWAMNGCQNFNATIQDCRFQKANTAEAATLQLVHS